MNRETWLVIQYAREFEHDSIHATPQADLPEALKKYFYAMLGEPVGLAGDFTELCLQRVDWTAAAREVQQ